MHISIYLQHHTNLRTAELIKYTKMETKFLEKFYLFKCVPIYSSTQLNTYLLIYHFSYILTY